MFQWIRKALTYTNPSQYTEGAPVILPGASPDVLKQQSRAIEYADQASLVMALVNWIGNSMAATPIQMVDSEGVDVPHYITELLETPNEGTSGATLRMAMSTDWNLYGNAYARMERDKAGIPIALHYIPYKSVEVKQNDVNGLITHYEIKKKNGVKLRVPRRNMIHLRRGMSPANTALGVSPLKPLMSEVWVDIVAGNYTGDLLNNWGVPGLVVSPEPNGPPLSPMKADEIREYVNRNYGTGKRGSTLTLTHPMKVVHIAFSPSDMDLSMIRNLSEERVSAVFGIPPAIVGFGTGLEKGDTRATHRDMRKQAWVDGVLPIQRLWETQLSHQLLATMVDLKSTGYTLAFDTTEIEELQSERVSEATRWRNLVSAGIATRADAREAQDLEVRPGDDVYLLPMNIVPVPAGAATDSESLMYNNIQTIAQERESESME